MGFKFDIRLGKFVWTIDFNTSIDEVIDDSDIIRAMMARQGNQMAHVDDDDEAIADRTVGFKLKGKDNG